MLYDGAEALALRPICDAVHVEGSLIFAQLLHAGRYAKIEECVAPSAIPGADQQVLPA
ncbi:oxidoreductase [Hyphomicrobium sp.]|uniref:oxidoreductase n=1 Tax=Hyphomicrobium sp. TaxID=82 RepID=UPI002FE212E4